MENAWLKNVNFKEIYCKKSCAYTSKAEGQVVCANCKPVSVLQRELEQK